MNVHGYVYAEAMRLRTIYAPTGKEVSASVLAERKAALATQRAFATALALSSYYQYVVYGQ